MDQRPVQPEHTPSREPLGDDFTDRDRQFDQLISRTIGEVTSPPGLTDRVVAASLEELRRTTGPIPFPVGRVRTRSVAAQWLAMAACLGLLVAGGWLVMQSTAPRAVAPTGAELVASDPMPVDVTPLAISPAAELVLLETSRPAAFDDLSPYVATRDLRFDDLSGDLVAVLDAIQNPVMGTYDLEFTP